MEAEGSLVWHSAVPVPRPVGHVPGLAVVKALSCDGLTESAGVQIVEVYMYPGNGEIVYTATQVRSTAIHPCAYLLETIDS